MNAPTPERAYVMIGLMSGSSLDGLDLAAVRFTPTADNRWHYTMLAAETQPYSPEWAERLAGLMQQTAENYAKTHVDYGHYLGMKTWHFIMEHGLAPDGVGSHGHTVFHQPQRHFTAQIGCGQTMVSHLGCPLVTDFRAKDVALGGEGAPLVPFGEHHLFPQYRLFLNLGGIASISLFPRPGEQHPLEIALGDRTWMRKTPEQFGYDVCPCNQVLNLLAQRLGHDFDDGGQLAASGLLHPALLADLDALSFYYLSPPRTLGREFLDDHVLPVLQRYSIPVEDQLHTVCHHIAGRIAAELERFAIRDARILVTGGGAYNHFLVHLLTERLRPMGILPEIPDRWYVNFKEALIFGFLGLMTLLGRPNTLEGVTGARSTVIGGAIHLPERRMGLSLL